MTDTFVSIHPAVAAMILCMLVVESSMVLLVLWLRSLIAPAPLKSFDRLVLLATLTGLLFLIGYLTVAIADAALK